MRGIHVPIVTPFAAGGDVDVTSLERLAHQILGDGAAGLVALGTTGESQLLSAAERHTVVSVCRRVSDAHRTPLTVGAGGVGTTGAVEEARELSEAADALLVPVPYYLRPSDEGVLDHFAAIGAATDVPLVVYNIPYRSGKTLRVQTLLTLLARDGVAGVKHCAGAIDADTLTLLARGHGVLGGDDAFLYPVLQLGAAGGVVATANVAAGALAAMDEAVRSGDAERARSLHEALLPVTSALFAEPSPGVIKAVLAQRGSIEHAGVRAPLRAPAPASVNAALDALKGLTA